MAYYVDFAPKVLNFIAYFKKKLYFSEKMKSWHGTCLLNRGEVKNINFREMSHNGPNI